MIHRSSSSPSHQPHFGPNVIGEIEHVTRLEAHRATVQSKQIGVLATPSRVRLEQGPHRVVAGKGGGGGGTVRLILVFRCSTVIHFHPRGSTLAFPLRHGAPHALQRGGAAAGGTGRLVHPRHFVLKVARQALHETVRGRQGGVLGTTPVLLL